MLTDATAEWWGVQALTWRRLSAAERAGHQAAVDLASSVEAIDRVHGMVRGGVERLISACGGHADDLELVPRTLAAGQLSCEIVVPFASPAYSRPEAALLRELVELVLQPEEEDARRMERLVALVSPSDDSPAGRHLRHKLRARQAAAARARTERSGSVGAAPIGTRVVHADRGKGTIALQTLVPDRRVRVLFDDGTEVGFPPSAWHRLGLTAACSSGASALV